jgi:hypothetical protein
LAGAASVLAEESTQQRPRGSAVLVCSMGLNLTIFVVHGQQLCEWTWVNWLAWWTLDLLMLLQIWIGQLMVELQVRIGGNWWLFG